MDLKKCVGIVKDYPKKGISFKDISPLCADKKAFKKMIDEMIRLIGDAKFDKIIAADARGFIFGSVIAYQLGKGLVIARKTGKLPNPGKTISSKCEYGNISFQVGKGTIKAGDRCIVVDDLLATGGSAKVLDDLCKHYKGKVVGNIFAIELTDLKGGEILEGFTRSVIQYKI